MCKEEHCKHSDAENPFGKAEFTPLADTGRRCTNPKPQREPGFYWAKHNEYKGWESAYFDVNKNWWFTGWGTPFLEEEVAEIDERRIERQPNEGCGCNTESKLDQCVNMLKKLTYDPRFPEGGVDFNTCWYEGMKKDERLTAAYLMQLHPELTPELAADLLQFSKEQTITHIGCYGDGSIIYPFWKAQLPK